MSLMGEYLTELLKCVLYIENHIHILIISMTFTPDLSSVFLSKTRFCHQMDYDETYTWIFVIYNLLL